MTMIQSGVERIAAAFENASATHSAALMPYFTLGYPNRDASLAAIEALAAHSDLMELGVPFSDPIADGPTVQRTTQAALEAGMTVKGCLDIVRELRARDVDTPAMLMGYMNPVMAYGVEQYVKDAKEAGVDGFIVPDLPPEESAELEQLAAEYGLAYIHFLAPTSSKRRISEVVKRARGFIYMVSLTGVTGARSTIRDGLSELVATVREEANVPVAVGFGISNPEQAGRVGTFADGVIVGSAILNSYDAGGAAGSAEFAAALKNGLLK
ncbi:MAG: tryptophan synthase subunit alpha [Candidatus Promineifilaceae bacterium]